MTNITKLEELAIGARKRNGLRKVDAGLAMAIEGWLAYGEALNEARDMLPSDEQFEQWVSGNLPKTARPERSAAMWAAANPDQLALMQGMYPRVRTVRGWYAKWQEQNKSKSRKG